MSENSTLYTRISQLLYDGSMGDNFVPNKGELVVYPATTDKNIRFKIGDGKNTLSELPFANDIDDFEFSHNKDTNQYVLTVKINGVTHVKSVPATTPVLTDGVEIASVGDNKIYAPRVTTTDNMLTTTYSDDNTKVEVALLKSVLKEELLNAVYPVGSIYMSVNNSSPESFLGGKWEVWGRGRVPVGAGELEGHKFYPDSTVETERYGGNFGVGISADQIPVPQHTHDVILLDRYPQAGGATLPGADQKIYSNYTASNHSGRSYFCKQIDEFTCTGVSNPFIATTPTVDNRKLQFSIMQPYITCYMWKRTA